MFLLRTEECTLVGASPEMLVRVTGSRAETRPIAGTRPRGKNPDEDAKLAIALVSDPKENAEHLMLVDLSRNDLGRVSRSGSVEVSNYCHVERYSHVMHLVTDVTGEMREDQSPIDVFLSCFPAGTVSGAPKIRAMELIISRGAAADRTRARSRTSVSPATSTRASQSAQSSSRMEKHTSRRAQASSTTPIPRRNGKNPSTRAPRCATRWA